MCWRGESSALEKFSAWAYSFWRCFVGFGEDLLEETDEDSVALHGGFLSEFHCAHLLCVGVEAEKRSLCENVRPFLERFTGVAVDVSHLFIERNHLGCYRTWR